jgi:hypothetical protein
MAHGEDKYHCWSGTGVQLIDGKDYIDIHG